MTARALFVFFAIPGTLACASGHPAQTGSAPDAEGGTPFRAGTYNTGLAPLDVEYATERAPLVVRALGDAASSLAVLCVQEVWLDTDYQALKNRLSDELPHAIRLPAEPGDSTCSPSEIGPLKNCCVSNCPGKSGQDLATCALAACANDFNVSASCADCLLKQSSAGGDIQAIEQGCLGGSDGGSSDAALYGGSYDTALFTRAAPLEEDSLKLDAYLVRSAVHYAKVPTDHDDAHLFCAHLASSIPPFEYRGKHGSWEEEQAYQIDQLLAFVKDKAGESGQVVVLGDMNTGPAEDNIRAELPDLYGKFIAAGLSDPYATSGSPKCTLCPDNTIRGAGSAPELVDHVFVRGFNSPPSVERFMTATTSITPKTSAGDAGTPDAGSVSTSLSDHYGLRATFSR